MSSSEYAAPPWWDFRQSARLRRKQLDMTLEKLQQSVPYARFVYVAAWVWLFANFFVFFNNWVFGFFSAPAFTFGFWLFVFYMVVSFVFLLSVFLHSWVMKYWPETIKVQVGNSPDMSAKEFVPGKIVDSVELPETDKTDSPKKAINVELILHGGVNNLPIPRRKPYVTIARCTVKGKTKDGKEVDKIQAGILTGPRYFVPCKPNPYVAGDCENWRGVNWFALARKHFGRKVTKRTILVIALDPLDPEKWELPPDDPSLIRELYEAKLRVSSLEHKLTEYLGRDTDRSAMSRRQAPEDEY